MSPAWDDVSRLPDDGRRTVSVWRQPLRALSQFSSTTSVTPGVSTATAANAPDLGLMMCIEPQGTKTRGARDGVLQASEPRNTVKGASIGAAAWRQHQREKGRREAVQEVELQQQRDEGVVAVGEIGIEPQRQSLEDTSRVTEVGGVIGVFQGDNINHCHRFDEPSREGGSRGDGSRVRGFHDMICIGFAVSLCLNVGSLTARREGYFAAEVKCLPQGASQTVLPDLGVWVGWRQAVANSEEAVTFNLEDLSMAGATMGILTVVGHATDALLNTVGLSVLLYGRRKPLQEPQCRLVKRLCLASLAMAGWLMGMTVIGFLVAVKGPIGAAAVAFYSDEFDLDCGNSVSVSVDYAYAMTTLIILCQFFIGIVALPKPPRCGRWSPSGVLLMCLGCPSAASDERELPPFSAEVPTETAVAQPTAARRSANSSPRGGCRRTNEGIEKGEVGIGSCDPV